MVKGVYTALVTPFKDGNIDYDSLKNLIQFQLDGGIQGFVVSGTTGEGPTLTTKEKMELLDFVCKEAGGKVPIIFGSGSNCTKTTIELSKKAEAYDVEALLVVVPYYNKPTQDGLYWHFKTVADNTKKPIILYNVPGRTIVNLEPDTITRLAEHPNIVGIKEANPDVNNFAKYKGRVGDDFSLLSGDDASCVGFCLLGGHGVISVCSHLAPKKMVEWITRALDKEQDVRTQFRQQSIWIEKLYMRSNPIPVKAALEAKEIIASRELRLPLLALNDEEVDELKYILKEFTEIL